MIKKRSRVISVFPNAESCIRYANCLLMEIDEDWRTGRKYIRMDDLEEDNDSDLDEDLMEEISRAKEESEYMRYWWLNEFYKKKGLAQIS